MIVDKDIATYVLAVVTAVNNGDLYTEDLTSGCPECGEEQTDAYSDAHLVTVTPAGQTVVIVACEGYWVVDPALVDIQHPNWQPVEN